MVCKNVGDIFILSIIFDGAIATCYKMLILCVCVRVCVLLDTLCPLRSPWRLPAAIDMVEELMFWFCPVQNLPGLEMDSSL